jgi:hypothetical protein
MPATYPPPSLGCRQDSCNQVHAIEFTRSAVPLLVGGEVADGVFEVGVGGKGVAAGGVESGVAEGFGDGDDVDAGAEQVGGQGVPQSVCGQGEGACFVDDVGVGGEFVHELVDSAGGEASAAAVDE